MIFPLFYARGSVSYFEGQYSHYIKAILSKLGGDDKVLISKFSILTTGELFIGYIQTMFGF